MEEVPFYTFLINVNFFAFCLICEYLVNGDGHSKHYYCHETGSLQSNANVALRDLDLFFKEKEN